MHWWDGMMGWMGLWWVVGVALIAALFWAVLKAGGGARDGSKESPEEILRRRYAKGEIDRQTFDRMLKDLRGESHS